MPLSKTTRPTEFYHALPKVDLHRHLEGSIRLSTLMDVGREHGIDVIGTDYLRPLVQIREGEPLTFENFLSKFIALREFYRSPDVIARITQEAIEDAALDNLRYLELRFTPVALSNNGGFPLHEVMDWVIEAAKKGEDAFGVTTRLIVSINRHESVKLAEKVACLAADRKDSGIVGLDLAGGEAHFPATPFLGVFREARQSGLHLTIHAGEWGEAANVQQAMEDFDAERIGHGVRVMEDPAIVDLARQQRAVFEVCVTSNYQSGVVPSLGSHPLQDMLSAGLQVTLNTDDPHVSQITLSTEYKLACEELGIPLSSLVDCILRAASVAFLPEEERQTLVESLRADLIKYA